MRQTYRVLKLYIATKSLSFIVPYVDAKLEAAERATFFLLDLFAIFISLLRLTPY